MTQTLSRSLLSLAIAAAALAPLAASANPAYAEGVSFPPASDLSIGKTRAEVRAELEAWRKNPVSHDGWRDDGETLVYVGRPTSYDQLPAAANKQRVTLGNSAAAGVTESARALAQRQLREHPTGPTGTAQANVEAEAYGAASMAEQRSQLSVDGR